ncbi:MAG: CoA-binding protein [Thermoplasmatota archaeon]
MAPQPPPSSTHTADPRDLLRRFGHLTIIGTGATPGKDAHDVPRFMLEHGYEVIAVNPSGAAIFGKPAAKSLDEAPRPLGMVAVFRPGPEAAAHVERALALGAQAIWLPLEVVSAEARAAAAQANVPFVENVCLRVTHQLLWGNGPRPR